MHQRNRSKLRATLLAATLGLASAAAMPTLAHDHDHDHDGGKSGQPRAGHVEHHGPGPMGLVPGMIHPGMLQRMADDLGLTTEQRQTIRGLFETARPEMDQLREQMQAAGRQLADTAPTDPNYATVVQRTSQQLGDLTSRMVTQGSQLRAQVHGLLTKEQQTKLAQLQAERRAKLQQRMQERRERMRERREGSGAPPAASKG